MRLVKLDPQAPLTKLSAIFAVMEAGYWLCHTNGISQETYYMVENGKVCYVNLAKGNQTHQNFNGTEFFENNTFEMFAIEKVNWYDHLPALVWTDGTRQRIDLVVAFENFNGINTRGEVLQNCIPITEQEYTKFKPFV